MSQTLTNRYASLADSNSSERGKTGAFLMTIWSMMFLIVWGFAFVPIPEKSPEWILQAQAACFGTLSNGLPAPHGWLLLVLSPLALLSMLWASHAEELYAAPSYIKKSPVFRVLAILIILTLMWEAHLTGKRITFAMKLSQINSKVDSSDVLPMDYPRANQAAPEFRLLNHKGELISQKVFDGKVTLLTFAFAHCSSICPMLIKTSIDAQKKVGHKDLQIVVLSIDPWRDTPASLPSLAKTWSIPENSQLLSGEPELVSRVLADYKVTTARDLKTGDINHAGQAMLVDRNGRIAYSFLNPTTSWLASAAERLLIE